MYKKSILLMPLLMITVGCNNAEPPENGLAVEGNDTYYSQETNLNANNFRNLSTQRPVISDDQDKIRIAVNHASGLVPQWVSIIGNSAYVHVNVPISYSKDRREKLEERLVDAITTAVPRYTIHLRIDN
jgi:hypothetical protein